MKNKINRRLKLKMAIRRKVKGTSFRPRLSVFRSNSQIYAQIIDDTASKTLVSASSLKITEKLTKTEKATRVGKLIAEGAKEHGITNVVFDRNGYLYHGRVQALAEAAREVGLNF